MQKIIKNPIIGYVIGLIGIIISIYFFLESREFRKLIYTINPNRIAVLNSKNIDKFEIFHNSKKIKGDVYSIQIAFWNHGTLPIKQQHILKPIRILTKPSVEILDVAIRHSPDEHCNLSVANNKNELKIFWNILEKGDGASVQILYQGSEDVNFVIDGIIEGKNEIKEVAFDRSGNGHPEISIYAQIILVLSWILISVVATIKVIDSKYLKEIGIICDLSTFTKMLTTKCFYLTFIFVSVALYLIYKISNMIAGFNYMIPFHI